MKRKAYWREKLAGVTSIVEAFTRGRETGFATGYQAGYRKGFDDCSEGKEPICWMPAKRRIA